MNADQAQDDVRDIIITSDDVKHLTGGEYQRSVLFWGHEAGTLSGSDLTGSTKKWFSSYAKSRIKVEGKVLAKYSVMARKVLCGDPPRHKKVWVDSDGQRVRFVEA